MNLMASLVQMNFTRNLKYCILGAFSVGLVWLCGFQNLMDFFSYGKFVYIYTYKWNFPLCTCIQCQVVSSCVCSPAQSYNSHYRYVNVMTYCLVLLQCCVFQIMPTKEEMNFYSRQPKTTEDVNNFNSTLCWLIYNIDHPFVSRRIPRHCRMEFLLNPSSTSAKSTDEWRHWPSLEWINNYTSIANYWSLETAICNSSSSVDIWTGTISCFLYWSMFYWAWGIFGIWTTYRFIVLFNLVYEQFRIWNICCIEQLLKYIKIKTCLQYL